jgi:dihydroorotase
MTKAILITGGRVVDPANKIDGVMDVLVENGRIAKVGPNLAAQAKDARVIDAAGKVVAPGLIDIHVHFREPGFEHKEDLESGLRCAVRGGFTGVCPMPNTKPVIQTQADVEFMLQKSRIIGLAEIFPVAAVTRDQDGKELTEFGELKKGGVFALSDDGRPIQDSNVMRRALEYSKKFDLVIMAHCEDTGLFGCGCMNEGLVSTKLGLQGIPVECESVEVARDLQLADLTGGRLHFCHMSSKKSLELIREAKKNGSRATAETAPHYWTLTDEAVLGYNTRAKMNPPLRRDEDVRAVREALRDGTIDVIATDHAPHAEYEKSKEFDKAPFGITGLETSLALSLNLVREGVITMSQMIDKMSRRPAEILKVARGTLSAGAVADVTIFDPDDEWIVDEKDFESKSKNSPFLGWKMKGRATEVLVGGKLVLEQSRILQESSRATGRKS